MAEETGATKSKNPHEPSLGRFLRGREQHVNAGCVGLHNGQILREDTLKRWKQEGRIK